MAKKLSEMLKRRDALRRPAEELAELERTIAATEAAECAAAKAAAEAERRARLNAARAALADAEREVVAVTGALGDALEDLARAEDAVRACGQSLGQSGRIPVELRDAAKHARSYWANWHPELLGGAPRQPARVWHAADEPRSEPTPAEPVVAGAGMMQIIEANRANAQVWKELARQADAERIARQAEQAIG